ncbi:undecaprenyl-diphosphate phosphatase [Amnibacterium kyonggiense]|uniref:Undecaprenyl-diphosphatase n=1 Tax=Amnibacterium kyonggiense TaxID=595671 RepID=A0A4R7FL16_9MICO|nr:undecaprenyl-diphosphate phosphatase [Amnibacterium kyonggiense]TDS77082.1 undecaprenyl-diphosphatase [Amnibacterium kyonggiense]
MIEALVLGLIQGLTEFIPVSSSAHIRIAGLFFGAGDPGAAFTAIIQLGTETAVLVYFWKDIVRIVRAFFLGLLRTKGPDGQPRVPRTDHDYRMGWLIIIGSIPIVVLGLIFQTMIETTFRSLWIVAFDLIVFGVLLGVVDRLGKKRKTIEQLNTRDGVIFGFAQALALVPGVSRSGGTIGAGLVMGYTRAAAARYSFLLAIPAVWGSGLYQLYKTVKEPCTAAAAAATGCAPEIFNGAETLAATVVSFVVGLVVIAFFLRYLNRGSFLPFVAYRILIGILLIGLLLAGVIQPN